MAYTGEIAYQTLAPSLQEHLEGLKTPLVNDLTIGDVDKGATAESVKGLNTKTNNHIGNKEVHIQSGERSEWNKTVLKYSDEFLTGAINFDNLAWGYIYQIGNV
ncbi:hypothetical protein [Lysinibacillus sphaericus]|uniref:Uncharacterized protein n=1 Tax=Lysinibacillus sphaericus OT4b.31 TaxID=1285586 RepID=R7Z806_LYSSH|nr:hypothetical protein [Lysinibacillus sphaericus]EON70315.1 hypothetical protein H131_21997 [Lysinibacillus sphaericus OT4b.31]